LERGKKTKINLKGFFRNNFLILFIYLIASGTSLYFLLNYEKNDIHFYLNQFVGNPFLNHFFYYITYLGDGRVAAFILLAILIYNIRLGIYATASFLTATLFSIALKHVFFDDVMRPSFIFKHYDHRSLRFVDGIETYIHNSFPSGHATQAFSILLCLAFVTQNKFYKLIFFGLAFFTALSRVYISQHWLSDITAGSAIGLIFSMLYYYVFIHRDKLKKLNRSLVTFKSH
jgi:membrane-associated phospholipid phosphatase